MIAQRYEEAKTEANDLKESVQTLISDNTTLTNQNTAILTAAENAAESIAAAEQIRQQIQDMQESLAATGAELGQLRSINSELTNRINSLQSEKKSI